MGAQSSWGTSNWHCEPLVGPRQPRLSLGGLLGRRLSITCPALLQRPFPASELKQPQERPSRTSRSEGRLRAPKALALGLADV